MKKNTIYGLVFIMLFLLASSFLLADYFKFYWYVEQWGISSPHQFSIYQQIHFIFKPASLVLALALTVMVKEKSMDNKAVGFLVAIGGIILFEIIYFFVLRGAYPVEEVEFGSTALITFEGKFNTYAYVSKLPLVLYLIAIAVYVNVSTNYMSKIDKLAIISLLVGVILVWFSKVMLITGYSTLEFFTAREHIYRPLVIDNIINSFVSWSLNIFVLLVLGVFFFSEEK